MGNILTRSPSGLLRVALVSATVGLSSLGCESGQAEAPTPKPASPQKAAAPAGKAATATAAVHPGSAEHKALEVGSPAPQLTLKLHDGRSVELAKLKGKQVVVYFYPKDDTSGCTVEAQGIRDNWSAFKEAGVEVFGVSMQDAASHLSFAKKNDLPFALVVEAEPVAKAFGVPVRGGEYAARHTFLIGADGNIKAVWRKVDPSMHAKELLEAAAKS